MPFIQMILLYLLSVKYKILRLSHVSISVQTYFNALYVVCEKSIE